MQMNYLANTAILIFEFSAEEDITSDYGFLLRLGNIFTIDTDEYYTMCYKVNMMTRLLKTFYRYISFYALTSQIIICIVYCRLARLTGAFKILLTQCCVLSDLIKRISNYMCQILSFAKDQDHAKRKKTSADMELKNYPKPSVYLYNY